MFLMSGDPSKVCARPGSQAEVYFRAIFHQSELPHFKHPQSLNKFQLSNLTAAEVGNGQGIRQPDETPNLGV